MANDMFLEIEGIEGECQESGHENWIAIESFDHNMEMTVDRSNVGSTGGRTSGRVTHGDFKIEKRLDKASPLLMEVCSNGKHIPKITLELWHATEVKAKYLEIIIEDVIVSNISYSDRVGSTGKPLEHINFNYARISWKYTEMDDTGSVGATIEKGWNLAANDAYTG